MHLLIVNGPNLNMLGTREPEVYGTDTLVDLERRWRRHASRRGIGVRTFQSNHEGDIIDRLQAEGDRSDGVIINPGAYSHSSYAIHDAVMAIDTPTVEVHLSNIHEREPWRAVSVTAPAADLMIFGRGAVGYLNAIDHLWAREAVPPDSVAYGPGPDQFIELRSPRSPAGLAVLIHGGFWRTAWGRDIMDPLAIRLHEEGWATATIEYRRGPDSFEAATADVAAAVASAIDHTDTSSDLPVVLVGHSAGGYLALREAVGNPRVAALGLAPVIDLGGIAATRADDDPIAAFLGASATDDPDRWHRAALDDLPTDRIGVVHGADDESVPVEHSRALAERHPGVALRVLDDVDHMSLIDPLTPVHGEVVAALTELRDRMAT